MGKLNSIKNVIFTQTQTISKRQQSNHCYPSKRRAEQGLGLGWLSAAQRTAQPSAAQPSASADPESPAQRRPAHSAAQRQRRPAPAQAQRRIRSARQRTAQLTPSTAAGGAAFARVQANTLARFVALPGPRN